jgi:hypothetical protein
MIELICKAMRFAFISERPDHWILDQMVLAPDASLGGLIRQAFRLIIDSKTRPAQQQAGRPRSHIGDDR